MTTLPTGGRVSRRALQRRRRRRRQVLVVSIVLGVLAVLAAGFAVYLAADAPGPPASSAPAARTQQTLLLQVEQPGGTVGAGALLAQDPEDDSGAVLLVPPQVIVTVPGSGSLPFGQALATGEEAGARNALSDLIGVTVDGSWVLPTTALAALVDAVGGVPVEVDVAIVRDQTVVLTEGAQRLDGARAVEFLGHLAEGEQEQARLARVQEVLDGLLTSLPPTPDELVPVLQGLGEELRSTLEPRALAELLLGLAAADDEGQLQYDTLPVVPIETGGATAFRIDAPRLQAVVDRLLAESVPAGVREGGNRVLVLNGVGTPGLGQAVRDRLTAADFVFVGSRNAPQFGYATTQILVPEATPEAQALGERVAAAIGVPGAQVVAQDFGTVADVVVLVGADFAR